MIAESIACCGAVIQDIFIYARLASKGKLETVQRVEYSSAGPVCNVSIALAALGLKTEAIGVIGRDQHAQMIRNSLEAASVMTSGLAESSALPTGTSFIVVTPDGDRTIYFSSGPMKSSLRTLSTCPQLEAGACAILAILRSYQDSEALNLLSSSAR